MANALATPDSLYRPSMILVVGNVRNVRILSQSTMIRSIYCRRCLMIVVSELLGLEGNMGRAKFFYHNGKFIRNKLMEATDLANQMLGLEYELIEKLYVIDRYRYYVRIGYRSLSGFCIYALKLSKTQAQRIVTQVRRYEPTDKIMDGSIIVRPTRGTAVGVANSHQAEFDRSHEP